MFKTNFVKASSALMLALVLVSGASAVTTTHTTSASFLASTAPGFYFENFASVGGGPVASLSFGPVNGFSYTIDTPPGSLSGLFNDPGLISTDNAADMIRVSFTGAPVTAVGGDMFSSDINFNAIPATVVIALSDGTMETFASTSASDFRGFTTTGPAITSLTIDALEAGGINAWPTLDNLYVGAAVPEPGCAFTALGSLMLLALRRRA